MPIVQLSTRKGKPAGYVADLGDAIHATLVETDEMPPDYRFRSSTS